jgi:class 3 adenylate cyclase
VNSLLTAAGSERAVIFGISEGGTMALLFAASHPDKVSHVITFGGYAKSCAAPDYPHMPNFEERRKKVAAWTENWGKGTALDILVPKLANSEAARRLFGRIERACNTPNAMRRYFDMNLVIDIRDVLPAVQAPTLVMHHEDDRQVPFSNSEYLATAVAGAKLVNCGSGGHYFWSADIDSVISEIRAFLSGASAMPQGAERILATVLFTDIVESTQSMSDLGDERWRTLLDRHDAEAADLIELHRGRFVKSTGDGLLATIDGPGRAVKCACTFVDKAMSIGIRIRAGLHTGEIENRGNDVGGAAVHAAARIEETAGPGEVVVSRTVTDLMIGNDAVNFEELGNHELKGLLGEWPLFRAVT